MKKELRKMIFVSLGFVMLSSLAACKTKTAPAPANTTVSQSVPTAPTTEPEPHELVAEEGAQVRFTYWAGSPSDEAAWKLILDGFTKDHPEIKLEAEEMPSNTYATQLDTLVAGNDWPDVMRCTYQRLGKYKESGVLLDLTDIISKESIDDLVPAYRNALTYEGKLLGMPHHTDTVAVFYNKEMFEKSGIRIPTSTKDGWTWDELDSIAKKLKSDHDLENAFAGIWENNNGYRFLPFVYMNGGALLNDDGTKITADTPEFINAIKLFESWRKDNLVTATGMTQPNQANSMFVAKKLAFVFAGSWHCSYMEENFPGNWGVTYMPVVDGKTGSDMGGNGLFAYKGTKYPNASAIFIDYVTNAENMQAFCEEGNFIPVRQSLIDKGLTFVEFQDEMNIFLNIVSTIDPKMAQDETSAKFQQLNLAFCQEMDPLVVNGSATAEEVVSNLQAKLQEILDEQ